MDLSSLLGTVLSSNSTSSISSATGVSNDQVHSVLGAALPALLNGAAAQSNDSATAAGFASALTQHSASNTSDLGAFFSGVDTNDGAKIVEHLLGSDSDKIIAQIAGESGVKKADAKKVLSSAAPLLMSLLGKEVNSQQQSNNPAGVAGVMSSLLGGSGGASMLTGLLGGGSSSSNSGSGNLLSSLMGLLK